MKTIVIVVVAVVVLGGGAFLLLGGNDKKDSSTSKPSTSSSTSKKSDDTSGSSASTATPATTTPPASTGGTSALSITANDTSASPETINVKQGDKVTLTFNVSSQGTYHGGLDFKNAELGLDSGSIDEGSSGKVSFTATKSFKFTPYWYKSNVQKDYFVSVNVQ